MGSPLLRRAALAATLAATACLTPADPGAGDVGELRVRPLYAAGAEPEALGVSVDSAAVVALPDDAPETPAVDTVVSLPAPDADLAWVVEVTGEQGRYHVDLELRGGGRVLYRGEADVLVDRGFLGSAEIHDVPVTYVGPGAITAITVTPGSVTLESAGATQPFSAVARDADGAVVDVTFAWSSSNDAAATVDAATGVATAVATGVSTIAAAARGVSGNASLTVAEGGLTVTIAPESAVLLALDATRQFTAAATDASGAPVTGAVFTWRVDDAGVATVDGSGLATAVGDGVTNVVVETGGVSDLAPLEVVTDATVEVTPASATLVGPGATRPYTAVARRGDGSAIDGVTFTWSSSDPTIASVDPESGLVTAVATGSATITASGGGAEGSAEAIVTPVIASVLVTPGAATLTSAGGTQTFTAEARDSDGNPVDGVAFTWTGTNDGVATLEPAGASATATAVATGETVISAEAGGAVGSATLTVALGGLTVAVTPEAVTLTVLGAEAQLTASARDAAGTPITDATFTWLSRNGAIASVDATGRVRSEGEGTTWVVAEYGGQSDSAAITVATVASVEVTPASATLTALGHTQQFTAIVRAADGTVLDVPVTWSSSLPSVASVDPASGLATALANGSTTIAATAANVVGTAALVVDQVVTSVTVTPGAVVLTALGQAQTFGAVPRDANDNIVPTAIITWASADPLIASIDPASGVALAVANGQTTVTATAGGVARSASLTVRQRAVRLVISRSCGAPAAGFAGAPNATAGCDTLTAIGEQVQLSAQAFDANENPMPDAVVAWVGDADAVATVDAAGLVTAVGNGDMTATASADDAVSTETITVRQRATTVTIEPSHVTLSPGETVTLVAQAVDANGFVVAGAVFLWTSLDPAVATVDQAGVVVAGAVGDGAITATVDGVAGVTTVSVR